MGGTPRVKREPQRTCVGCRQVRPRSRLLRLVRKADGMVTLDQAGSAAGRGAYVCPLAECVAGALKGGRLARALRGRAEVSAELVAFSQRLSNGAGRR